MYEPFQSCLKGFRRVAVPVDKVDVVLAVRKAAARGRIDPIVATPVQSLHHLRQVRTRDEDAMLFGATGELKHGIDDLPACELRTRLSHGIILIAQIESRHRLSSLAYRRCVRAGRLHLLLCAGAHIELENAWNHDDGLRTIAVL